MILNYYFFYFSLCFFVFTKQVLSVFRDYCLSTRVSSSRKWHEFYCFCCRGRLCIDDDGNVVIVVVVVVVVGGGSSGGGNDGGGNCCCCRSCSCWWGVLAYHHTRRLGVSQSSSASWTATKNTLYHLNTQTLVKSWSEFQESNRNMLDNSPLSPSLSLVFAFVYVLSFASFLSFIHSLSLSLASVSFFTLAFSLQFLTFSYYMDSNRSESTFTMTQPPCGATNM